MYIWLYRRMKSTTEAAMEQMKNIYQNLDEGKILIYLFHFFFTKAFDCIDQQIS